MSSSLLLLALLVPQASRTHDVGAPKRLESGEVLLPHDWFATQLLVPGDLDGNGIDDLFVSRVESMLCGNVTASGAIDRLSSARFPMAPAWPVLGQPVLALGTRADEPVLVLGHALLWEDSAAIEVRPLQRGAALWSLRGSELEIGSVYRTCVVPASDATKASKVIVANPWATEDGSGTAPWGAVMALSLEDGSTEWVRWVRLPDVGYGHDLAPAGDVDGDGTQDVAVCMAHALPTAADPARRRPHVEFLCGADGAVLARRTLGPQRVAEMRAVGDVDGDGQVDFVARGMELAEAGGMALWLALSGREEPVAVLPEQRIRWFTAWRDDDGRAALLVSVHDRASDARSLQLVGAHGARRIADDPLGEGVGVYLAESGDFDGDGLLDVALVCRRSSGSGRDANLVRVVSGLELR